MRKFTPVALLAFALAMFGAENKGKEMFARHWQTSKEFTVAVADAMPADGYSFKPNPEEMSFGELMIHIADANSRFFSRVSGEKPLAKPAPADKETAMKFLTESFDYCAKALDGITEEQLDKMVGPEGRQAMGREALWAAFTHTAHHRGQAEVYLRVKNIKPPGYRF